jgi:hypothetical protein
MKTIRRNVFETNSSSVHSLTMTDSETFKKWKSGQIFYDIDNKKFVKEQKHEDCFTYNEYNSWCNDRYFDTFEDSKKTKSGEVVIAFGHFGSDT